MWPFRRREPNPPRFCEGCGRSEFKPWQPVKRYDRNTGEPIRYELQWLCTNRDCYRNLPNPALRSV